VFDNKRQLADSYIVPAIFKNSIQNKPMKRIPFVVVLLWAALVSPSWLQAADGSSKAVEQTIQKLEQEWADALVKGDQAAIDRIVTKDWTLTDPEGALVTKSKADADLKSGTVKFESFKTDDLVVRVYGDTAVAFGLETEKSSYKGKDTSGQYRFTDVFVKIDGRWQAVCTQLTRVVQK
jgi:ketosteroid isomerase-like protein